MTERSTGIPERKPRFSTISDVPIERVYGPADLRPDATERIGEPGRPPFTRGIHPTGYRSRLQIGSTRLNSSHI